MKKFMILFVLLGFVQFLNGQVPGKTKAAKPAATTTTEQSKQKSKESTTRMKRPTKLGLDSSRTKTMAKRKKSTKPGGVKADPDDGGE